MEDPAERIVSDALVPLPPKREGYAPGYGPNGKERTEGWEEDFLNALRNSAILRTACTQAGVSSKIVSARRKSDPAFEEAYREALEEAIDAVESVAFTRAMKGQKVVREIVEFDHRGQEKVVRRETVTQYNDRLIIMILKAHRKHLYGDHVDHNHRFSAMREEVERIAQSRGWDDETTKRAIQEAERLMTGRG